MTFIFFLELYLVWFFSKMSGFVIKISGFVWFQMASGSLRWFQMVSGGSVFY